MTRPPSIDRSLAGKKQSPTTMRPLWLRRSRVFARFPATIPLSPFAQPRLKSLLVIPDAANKWPIEEEGGCAKPNRKIVQREATAAMTEIPELLKLAFAERVSLPLKETARLLGIDQKTLRGHIKAGNICFMTVGLGVTKLRREFTLSDILEFLERMRGRECPSISAATRPTTTMTSSGDILGFTARRAKLIAERRKHSSAPKRSA
jgi:hypothetical protein